MATEYKVKMACHPHDPGVPSGGYRGVERVLGTVALVKRASGNCKATMEIDSTGIIAFDGAK